MANSDDIDRQAQGEQESVGRITAGEERIDMDVADLRRQIDNHTNALDQYEFDEEKSRARDEISQLEGQVKKLADQKTQIESEKRRHSEALKRLHGEQIRRGATKRSRLKRSAARKRRRRKLRKKLPKGC